jgi:hypothetical protein
MTAFMELLPLAGFPRVDVPALVAEALRTSVAVGWTIHLFLGIVVFPTAFFLATRMLPRLHPALIGWTLGMCLFLGGEAVAIPLSGGGFFSSEAPQQGLTVLEDLLSHSLYGLTLGFVYVYSYERNL